MVQLLHRLHGVDAPVYAWLHVMPSMQSEWWNIWQTQLCNQSEIFNKQHIEMGTSLNDKFPTQHQETPLSMLGCYALQWMYKVIQKRTAQHKNCNSQNYFCSKFSCLFSRKFCTNLLSCTCSSLQRAACNCRQITFSCIWICINLHTLQETLGVYTSYINVLCIDNFAFCKVQVKVGLRLIMHVTLHKCWNTNTVVCMTITRCQSTCLQTDHFGQSKLTTSVSQSHRRTDLSTHCWQLKI